MSGNANEAKFLYAAMLSGTHSVGDPGFASQCVQCGEGGGIAKQIFSKKEKILNVETSI